MNVDRIHLISPANPLAPDTGRFGMDVDAFIAFARENVPRAYRLTYDSKLLHATEAEWQGGRTDDAARIRDLNAAIADRRTRGIVATNGGAYLTRILPHVDFSPLVRRKEPLWLLGFSEISGLVNRVASYRCGRGVYWLCPTWLGWAVKPAEAAREALAAFWRLLPALFGGDVPASDPHLELGPLQGELVAGRLSGTSRSTSDSTMIRIVGGCLAVLAANAGGPDARRIRPDGKWLLLEDIKEPPYRIDRHLATLKVAGWFERVAGVLVGDFRVVNKDTQPAVLELLKYHLLPRTPVITTHAVGHVWPMVPVLLNRPLEMKLRRRSVTIDTLGRRL